MKLGTKPKVAIVAAISAIALLSGCSSSGTSNESQNKSTTISWSIWSGSQAEVDAWNHVGDMVTKKYPNIKLKFSTTSFADYFTKMHTLAAGNQLPCIAATQAQRTAGLGSLFEPLNSHYSKAQLAEFNSTILKALSYDGSVVALPYDIGPYMVYYNKTAFQEAGLKLPAAGWTQDEFLADAKALSTNGKYGFAVTGYPDHWFGFATSAGANYLSDDGKKVDLTNAKMEAAWDWTVGLVTKEKVAPAMPATSDANWDLEQWQSGNAAMTVNGPWHYINTKNTVKFEFGLAPLPEVNGSSKALLTGSGFGVTKSCSNKDEAYKALSVLTGPAAEKYLGSAGRAFPARMSEQSAWLENATAADGAALTSALKTAVPFRTTKNWDRVSAYLFQYGVEALNGSQPPASVLQKVQQLANNKQ